MSTGAIVGYKDSKDNFRGTMVNFDGDLAGDQLNEMFGGDRQALVDWVEAGIAGNGYRNLDEVYNDGDEPEVCNSSDVENSRRYGSFIWLINEKGIVVKN